MKYLSILLILSLSCHLYSQVQLGQDIDGEGNGDQSGASVSISSDGSIVAIGALFNGGNGVQSGHVRVFQFNNSNNTWNQIGQDIDGEAAGDSSGSSIAISSDGSIVAIGAQTNSGNGVQSGHVRIFQFNNSNNTWNQIGQDIDGEAISDFSGKSVSLSANGAIVAIGASGNDGNGNNSGHVRVFQFNNNNNIWNQIGQDIDGEAITDFSGQSVSLSNDGSIVAIGANNNGIGRGHVRIYKFNVDNNLWSQVGQDIDGKADGDQSGQSVSISANGSIVAIGAPLNRNSRGLVRVYQFNLANNSWAQIGQDIEGEDQGDRSGTSISLSENGSILSIGANQNDGNGILSGHVRMYRFNESNTRGIFNSGTWTQIGQDIDGEAADDRLGQSVSLSSDGSIVAVGATRNDGNGLVSGHVRVYNISNALPVDIIKFTSRQNQDEVIISWATVQEINNDGYFLERSPDNHSWRSLGFIKGSGDEFNTSEYHFSDLDPLPINYYRLRQVDYDGTETFSKTISVILKTDNPFLNLIYPNPAQDKIYLSREMNGRVTIYSADGKVRIHTTLKHREPIDISMLAPGHYILESMYKGKRVVSQLVKE